MVSGVGLAWRIYRNETCTPGPYLAELQIRERLGYACASASSRELVKAEPASLHPMGRHGGGPSRLV